MNRGTRMLWPLLLILSTQGMAGNEALVVVQELNEDESSRYPTPYWESGPMGFPADVNFTLEALYPARNNQARAKKDLLYSCRDTQTGQRLAECFITIDEGQARENSGGHHGGHAENRPVGRHVPSAGWVSRTDGYFRSTYYASEVGGVVDVALHCNALIAPCQDGTVAFGVGVSGLEDLGPGQGYILTGAKAPHPSNHWGVPAFIAAIRTVAAQYSNDHPQTPLKFNDISLEYGGIFDVATRSVAGYSWSPPHSTHRLGTNMDIGIPPGQSKRQLALRLFSMAGIRVLQEDQYHWHLSY
jgi:hypothetical protein